MADVVEVRGLLQLAAEFKARNWPNPMTLEADRLSGEELLAKLDIPAERVEVLFVNGKACRPYEATIQAGDRVALVPPGVPGPYRVLLGFVRK